MDVSSSTRVPAPLAEVWRTVGDFTGLAAWHPAIAACTAEHGGRRRRVTLVDGSEIVEELVARDDAGASYTYTIVDSGPLPVRDYEATLRLVDQGGTATDVTWSGRFEPVGNATLAEVTIQRVYETGLDHLQSLFASA